MQYQSRSFWMRCINSFFKHWVFVICIVFTVLGCARSKEALNINSSSPDEFAVIRKKPLVIPPKFNLRPPASSEKELDKKKSINEARNVLVGSASSNQKKANRDDTSKGELVFLAKSGTNSSNSNIRKILQEENSKLASYSNSFVQRLVSSMSGEDKKNLVDPQKEQKRFQEKRSTGEATIKGQQEILIRRK